MPICAKPWGSRLTRGYAGRMPTPPFPGEPRDGIYHRVDEPLSDKSGVVAGLLQLFFGSFGAGRFYLGLTTIAILQLSVGAFGVLTTIIGFTGLPFLLGAAVWGALDAILIFTGSVKDRDGRTLRT